MRRFRRLAGFHAALALALALTAVPAAAAEPLARPASRAEATAIIANARKILTPNGIERTEKVRIGGVDQWVSIRGMDRRNPVLVFLHGGPGYVATPMAWWFGRGWEEYFTVVHWDQRASGRTHLLTDVETIKPTLTPDRILADTEELVAWARKTLGKEKVILVGHSGGSWLGLHLAQRRPEWLHAYVGVGQAVNTLEGERRGWAFAMEAARRDGNTKAMEDLQSIAPYPKPGEPISITELYTLRRWVAHYGGTMAYRRDNNADSALARLSPDYTDEESRHVWDGNALITPILLPAMLARDPMIPELKVPIILFAGRHDTNVNAEVGAEWLATLKAPEKHMVWFENSAHMAMTEEPGKFLVSLVKYARPIAERAGDAPK